MTWTKDEFTLTTDKSKIDIAFVHAFLRQSYWAQNIPLPVVEQSIEGSLCFSLLHPTGQIGFARVITDGATFGYLADVFVDAAWRGKGLSKWMMENIIQHPSLTGLRRLLLATRDAHGLYAQFGFKPVSNPESFMQIHRPGLYLAQDGGVHS